MLSTEYLWFLKHPEIEIQYAGEYIAIVGEAIVAHGKDFNEVLQEAKKYGEDPLLHKVISLDKALIV